MRVSHLLIAIAAAAAVVSPAITSAQNVAIITGSFYTPNLKNDLVAHGVTVTEISSYTAASLAPFDAVIMYGNDFADMTALGSYASAGGTVIETPWFWLNNSPTPALDIFTHGGSPQFHGASTGVTILDAGDPLLSGVVFPGSGGDVGRTIGNSFVGGITQVARWGDGTAMIGHKALGSGEVIGINLHVITSDTAYTVIDQPWATQLFVNAVRSGTDTPEPGALASIVGLGIVTMGTVVRRRSRR